jgi:chromosome segregation ATPase
MGKLSRWSAMDVDQSPHETGVYPDPCTSQETHRSLEQLFHEVEGQMERLLELVTNRESAAEEFASAKTALATLPLTTHQYSLSIQRLKTAMSYAAHGEIGAARFELSMLRKVLAKTRLL